MTRPSVALTLLAALALAAACDNKDKPTTTTSASASTPASASAATPKAELSAAAMSATAAALGVMPPKTKLEPIVTFKSVGLSTPESVLYDEQSDLYIVSNIEGKQLEADNKGFISRLSPDGKVQTLKWIESGKNKATVNAPKGLAIMGDTLYVADLDTVRLFDRKSGAPTGEVKIPGATFLNDLATSSDGTHVLISDTGMKSGAGGFEPSGADAVYALDKTKKLTTLAKTKELGGPNGILSVSADETWVVTFGSGEMFSLDAKGTKGGTKKLPKGQLDGIVALPGGDILVSSWEGDAVYRGKPGGDFTVAIPGLEAPADIGYDTKRSRLLVPLFLASEIRVYEIK